MSTRYNPSIARDGLVFLVDAKNPKCFTDGVNNFNDLSGNGHNLIHQNGPTISDGVISLDSNAFLRGSGLFMGTANQSNVSYNFTIRLNWGFNGYKTIFGFQQSSFDRVANFVLNTSQDELEFDLRNNGTNNRNIFNYNMSDHKQKHTLVTYTFDSGTHKLYTNGILRSTATASLTTFPAFTGTSGGFAVGNNLASNRFLGQGSFSYMSIYLKTLTATEVLQNYNALKGRFGL